MLKTFHYGGQAIIEGIMMRGQTNLSMAVRRPNGEIDLTVEPVKGIHTGRIRNVPFIRGFVVLIEAMILGVRALFHSANISLEEEEEDLSGPYMWIILAVALLLAIGLFFLAPLFLVNLIDSHLGSSLTSNIIEGLIRIAIFILYLWVLNLIPSVRDVFSYHGAEHKVINAFEDGATLDVETTRKYSTAHARCGTSFILIILVMAIVVFALVGDPGIWLQILSRIVLIPVIAAVGYEINRFGAMHTDNPIIHTLLIPGLALQSLTTRQPNDAQLEIGIAALKGVLEADAVPQEQQA